MANLGLHWRISELIEYLTNFDHSDMNKEYLYKAAFTEYIQLVNLLNKEV